MAAPEKPLSHKERLLRQGMKSFYANGFHGTTVDAILDASGVPKGSFYHHFGSKDAFGLAVLDRYMHLQLDALAQWTDDDTLSTTAKLTRYFTGLTEAFVHSDFQRACLAGKFSTELAASAEPFRTQLTHALTEWQAALTRLLAEGQRRGDVRTDRSAAELSHSVLALIQGAFVIALSTRDTATLDAVCATFAPLLEP
ncbi:TetR/AcrR family transcriptional regulator [Mycobacterium talmoniae]|uniref:TetR family transcriptional regulator n=1 Tax=Mycobacterium talmoniae TaxID=1858794 RepID=A0A1S1NNQ8_9MYCO|nr:MULTISPECIES: TetR/AcrR family transcriptional regulator [Mycobacterium]OHV04394.1 TetR family transcriptional regulator [Mycobacterium talmoniae]PQM46901.1 Transcriptional regulator AcuR [Mycobacterium talmoniae]